MLAWFITLVFSTTGAHRRQRDVEFALYHHTVLRLKSPLQLWLSDIVITWTNPKSWDHSTAVPCLHLDITPAQRTARPHLLATPVIRIHRDRSTSTVNQTMPSFGRFKSHINSRENLETGTATQKPALRNFSYPTTLGHLNIRKSTPKSDQRPQSFSWDTFSQACNSSSCPPTQRIPAVPDTDGSL